MRYLRYFFNSTGQLESEYSLSEKATTMQVFECEKCNGWVPAERAPFFKRKKRQVNSRLCRECLEHERKCKLTRSLYVTLKSTK